MNRPSQPDGFPAGQWAPHGHRIGRAEMVSPVPLGQLWVWLGLFPVLFIAPPPRGFLSLYSEFHALQRAALMCIPFENSPDLHLPPI